MSKLIESITTTLRKKLDYKYKDPRKACLAVTAIRGKVLKQILEDLGAYYDAMLMREGPWRDRLQQAEMLAPIEGGTADPPRKADGKRFAAYVAGIISRVKPMLHADYEAPAEPNELFEDLAALHQLYHGYPFGCLADALSPLAQRTLEVVLIELSFMAGVHVKTMATVGMGQEYKTRAKKILGQRAGRKKQMVIELYYKIHRRGLSKTAIARNIKAEWERLHNEKSPSINSIKGYLSSEWTQE